MTSSLLKAVRVAGCVCGRCRRRLASRSYSGRTPAVWARSLNPTTTKLTLPRTLRNRVHLTAIRTPGVLKVQPDNVLRLDEGLAQGTGIAEGMAEELTTLGVDKMAHRRIISETAMY
jgi:hypothetical protein